MLPELHGSEFGRHLLEGDIPISQWVTVAQDGSGNFSTIGDAVQFVPNGTTIDNGYIAIYIGPGIYQENIVVAKNKKNLVMIGAGIDRTVITGNRSFVDGWTTYNSATFGKNSMSNLLMANNLVGFSFNLLLGIFFMNNLGHIVDYLIDIYIVFANIDASQIHILEIRLLNTWSNFKKLHVL